MKLLLAKLDKNVIEDISQYLEDISQYLNI